MDEAIAIAAAHPVARFGALELRETWPFDEPELAETPVATAQAAAEPPAGWLRYVLLMGSASDEVDMPDFDEPATQNDWQGQLAEAREHVAGFDLIQAPSLDEAIDIAAAHPANQIGAIEIRPLWPM